MGAGSKPGPPLVAVGIMSEVSGWWAETCRDQETEMLFILRGI